MEHAVTFLDARKGGKPTCEIVEAESVELAAGVARMLYGDHINRIVRVELLGWQTDQKIAKLACWAV